MMNWFNPQYNSGLTWFNCVEAEVIASDCESKGWNRCYLLIPSYHLIILKEQNIRKAKKKLEDDASKWKVRCGQQLNNSFTLDTRYGCCEQKQRSEWFIWTSSLVRPSIFHRKPTSSLNQPTNLIRCSLNKHLKNIIFLYSFSFLLKYLCLPRRYFKSAVVVTRGCILSRVLVLNNVKLVSSFYVL